MTVCKDTMYFDLYLYIVPKNDNLVRIPHLTRDIANKYAHMWLDMNELHECILVTEDSTPWGPEIPDITIRDLDWMNKEYSILKRNE